MLVLAGFVQWANSLITREYYLAKQAQQARLEDRYARIIAAAPDAIVSVDELSRVSDWNPKAEEMFGRPGQEAIGRPLEDLLGQGLKAMLAAVEQTSYTTPFEMVLRGRGGAPIPVEIRAVLADDAAGKRRVIATIRDISDRRRHEESVALLGHALEQAQFGVVISEVGSGKLTLVNHAYATLLGYTVEQRYGAILVVCAACHAALE
jgi:PAS domain S-box-containing protein